MTRVLLLAAVPLTAGTVSVARDRVPAADARPLLDGDLLALRRGLPPRHLPHERAPQAEAHR
ncbi:hypothetical protein ACFV7R_42310 [Streptomyces sp. NPDC059866]|uniref:hypothetical protein n=1 Tax=Streptomyces sp. NPDC059866 TaxID=3346978 RepID=UPI003654F99F